RAIVGDHRDDDLGAACLVDPARHARAERFERARLLRRAVVDRYLVPGLDQVRRHSRTHPADADESYFHEIAPRDASVPPVYRSMGVRVSENVAAIARRAVRRCAQTLRETAGLW